MDASTIAAITDRAASQRGAISLCQLAELEVSPSQVRTLRASGWLHPEAPRVFSLAGSPESVERRLMVGLLCLGDEAVVSHGAAARLHRFDRCRPDDIEFTLLRGGRGRESGLRVHTTRSLPAIDRVMVDGFRCTSATRTIIDLARARVPTIRLEAAIDTAVRTGSSSPVVVHHRLADLRGPVDGVRAGSIDCSSIRAATRCSSGGSSRPCGPPDCRARVRR